MAAESDTLALYEESLQKEMEAIVGPVPPFIKTANEMLTSAGYNGVVATQIMHLPMHYQTEVIHALTGNPEQRLRAAALIEMASPFTQDKSRILTAAAFSEILAAHATVVGNSATRPAYQDSTFIQMDEASTELETHIKHIGQIFLPSHHSFALNEIQDVLRGTLFNLYDLNRMSANSFLMDQSMDAVSHLIRAQIEAITQIPLRLLFPHNNESHVRELLIKSLGAFNWEMRLAADLKELIPDGVYGPISQVPFKKGFMTIPLMALFTNADEYGKHLIAAEMMNGHIGAMDAAFLDQFLTRGNFSELVYSFMDSMDTDAQRTLKQPTPHLGCTLQEIILYKLEDSKDLLFPTI